MQTASSIQFMSPSGFIPLYIQLDANRELECNNRVYLVHPAQLFTQNVITLLEEEIASLKSKLEKL